MQKTDDSIILNMRFQVGYVLESLGKIDQNGLSRAGKEAFKEAVTDLTKAKMALSTVIERDFGGSYYIKD